MQGFSQIQRKVYMGAQWYVQSAGGQPARGILANVLEPSWCQGCTVACAHMRGGPLIPWHFTIR